MKIPNKILQSWKLTLKHGEIQTIHEETGIARNTVSNAINNGNCEEGTFEAIKAYFLCKKKKEAKLIKQTLK